MIEKEFIPYQEALELKELGFDEPSIAYYLIPEIERTGEINLHYCSRGKEILRNNDWSWVYQNFPSFRRYLKPEHCYMYSTNSSKLLVSAPLFQQTFRWFRDKHELYGRVEYLKEYKAYYYVIDVKYQFEIGMHDVEQHYDDAELNCLRKLIEIVKQ